MGDLEEAEAAERAYWADKERQRAEFDEAVAVLKAELLRPFEVVLNWLIRAFGRRP